MKNTNWSQIRKLAHKPQWLAMAMAGGGNFLRRALRKDSHMRISPVALAAIIMYLESRRQCLDEDGNQLGGCVPLHDQVRSKLNTLYALAFSEALLKSQRDFIGNKEKGHQFQLAMLAALHLSYELSKDETKKVIAIEANEPKVYLYKKGVDGQLNRWGKRKANGWGREPDIVLSGVAGNTNVINAASIWIELKSYSYKKGSKPRKSVFRPWNMSSKRSVHRQMMLDRIAKEDHQSNTFDDTKQAGDFRWYFQKFRRTTIQGYTNDDMKFYVRDWLRALPKRNKAVALASLNMTSKAKNESFPVKKYFDDHVEDYSIRDWILDTGKSILLSQIDEEQIKEFITDDVIFDQGTN